jgi:hypothetical protein
MADIPLSPDRLLEIEKSLSKSVSRGVEIPADRLIDYHKKVSEQREKVKAVPSERLRELESKMVGKTKEIQQSLPIERASSLLSVYGALRQMFDIPPSDVIENRMRVMSDASSKAAIRGYRPSAWGSSGGVGDPSITMVYIMNSIDNINYFFDAVLKTEHTTTRTITKHPIQTGAAIADHSYQMPAIVTLEIGMSDAMDSYAIDSFPDIGSSNHVYPKEGSKSVNAYRTFVDLQKKGIPLTVNTRLNRYENMIITQISTTDDKDTTYSLKCTIAFEQVFIADVGVTDKTRFPAIASPPITTNVPSKGYQDKLVSWEAEKKGHGFNVKGGKGEEHVVNAGEIPEERLGSDSFQNSAVGGLLEAMGR